MLHHQHTHVSSLSEPMLRGDFISLLPKRGLDHVAENILSYLDEKSLCAAELVCKEWYQAISEGIIWKKVIERRMRTDSLWRRLMERRGYIKYMLKPSTSESSPDHMFYRRLHRNIIQEIENTETNWQGIWDHIPKIIYCRKTNKRNKTRVGVYCVQYDDHKIVSGWNNGTIKIWDRNTLKCINVLTGHTEPVMCVQFDDRVIISGSCDSTVRVWDVKTGELINTIHHGSAVFNMRFNNGTMVTSSRDRSITVWNMVSPSEITKKSVLDGHPGDVRDVDLDEKYIVSACGRILYVWNTSTCELVRTLEGHREWVPCLQYHDRLVVSGSMDRTIMIWDIESGVCLRTLEGHKDFVGCIKFDNKRIVSVAYGGEIKVWNLTAALDSRSPAETLCLGTSVAYCYGVRSLQFDDFQIVSSSFDNIFIFDFLKDTPPEAPVMDIWKV